jgi:hypothetical protein
VRYSSLLLSSILLSLSPQRKAYRISNPPRKYALRWSPAGWPKEFRRVGQIAVGDDIYYDCIIDRLAGAPGEAIWQDPA